MPGVGGDLANRALRCRRRDKSFMRKPAHMRSRSLNSTVSSPKGSLNLPPIGMAYAPSSDLAVV